MSQRMHYVYIGLLVMIIIALVFIGVKLDGAHDRSHDRDVKCFAVNMMGRNSFLKKMMSRANDKAYFVELEQLQSEILPYVKDGFEIASLSDQIICFAR